tara:strand:+ start:3529 stop:3696 length:168 start_codon:yes stop_codon:yes gene_type:complete
MQLSFEELQEALISEMITLPQFVEIILDNYGYEKGAEILLENLHIAINKDEKLES